MISLYFVKSTFIPLRVRCPGDKVSTLASQSAEPVAEEVVVADRVLECGDGVEGSGDDDGDHDHENGNDDDNDGHGHTDDDYDVRGNTSRGKVMHASSPECEPSCLLLGEKSWHPSFGEPSGKNKAHRRVGSVGDENSRLGQRRNYA